MKFPMPPRFPGTRTGRLVAALVVVWAAELMLVQERSLLATHSQTLFSAETNRVVRLLLDLLACTMTVFAMPRVALACLFAVNLLFYLAVLVYRDYFGQSLSILVVLNQSGEGFDVLDAAVALLRSWYLVFALTFAAKLALVFRIEPEFFRVTQRRAVGAFVLFAAYVVSIFVLNPLVKPMWKIAAWETVGGVGSIYGYLPTWAAELVYIDENRVLKRALERAKTGSDKLTPVEVAPPLHDRLVFLQVESLDLALIDFAIAGKPVTPELDALARRAMFYYVQSDKKTGSCDADLTALLGRLPSADVPTYKLTKYPFTGSIVEKLEQFGYRTTTVHGVSGEFFNRRFGFTKIPFNRVFFREELTARGIPAEGWTISDHSLLKFAAADLAAQPERHFMLIITASTHIPFHRFDASRAAFFRGSHDVNENFLDAFHEVDGEIGSFYRSLPPRTTLVMYGDHISKVEHLRSGYRQKYGHGVGLVPFLILNSDEDLSSVSQARKLATSGDLTLLDAVRYVHHHALSRQSGKP